MDNFVYEDTDENMVLSSQQHRMTSGATRLMQDESDEVEAENENSIPQESSIAGNVSFQNQRRATGTLNAAGGSVA